MKKFTLNYDELQSIKAIVEYMLYSECKHYEECDKNEQTNHIYKHAKILDAFLKT